MNRFLVLMAVTTMIGAAQGVAPAQQETQGQPGSGPQSTEVTVYQAVVIGDGTIEGAAKVISIGPERRNKADAEADERRWKDSHPGSLRLTDVRERTSRTPVGKLKSAKEAYDRVKEAKEAVDKAKEIEENGLTAKERQLGATLKEYTDRIKNAYEDVKDLKAKMTSLTGNLSRKQFDEANKLIARYNKSRDEIGRVEKELSAARADRLRASARPGTSGGDRTGRTPPPAAMSVLNQFPAIAPIDPQDFKDKLEPERPVGKWVVWVYRNVGGRWEKQEDQTFSSDDPGQAESYFEAAKRREGFTVTSNLPRKDLSGASLVGRRGRGTFMDGVTPFTVEFRAGGVGQFSTADESFPGTWSVQGRSVTLKAGASVMTGAIEGNRMQGNVYRANASSVVTGQRLLDRQGTWNLTVE